MRSGIRSILPRRRLDAHERLLVALVRRTGDPDAPLVGLEAMKERPVREAFHRLAQEHGVLGLALRQLQRAGLEDAVGRTVAREVLDPLRVLERQAVLWDMERDRLVALFHRSGLSMVLLKGAALRATVVADSVERSLGDLDVLVEPEHVADAIALARRAGYAPEWPEQDLEDLMAGHYHIPMAHRNGFCCEIHWGLDVPGSPVVPDAERFRARALEQPGPNGSRLWVPSPEDMVLHLAHQFKESGFTQLKRVVDIHRIVSHEPDLNWRELARGARSCGGDLRLALALQLARTIMGTRVPDTAMAELDLAPLTRLPLALLDPVHSTITRHAVVRNAAYRSLRLWTLKRWRDRAAFLVEMIWRPPMTVLKSEEPRQTKFRPFVGSWRIVQLLGYNALVFLRAMGLVVSQTGRESLRFWRRGMLGLEGT
jgi:hypothetical protein